MFHSVLECRDGELVWRTERGLRREQRPGADAGILRLGAQFRGSKLNRGNECEQREFKNESSSIDGTNFSLTGDDAV